MSRHRFLNSAGKLVLPLLAPLLILLAACIPALAASNGPSTPSGVAADWGYADFDGDHKPDFAELHRASLKVRLSSGKQLYLAISLSTAPGKELVVFDFDGDNDLDIVVRNRFLTEQVDIWLNDGSGSFTESSYDNKSIPNERESSIQARLLVPAISITIRPLNPIAGLTAASRLIPPSSGTESYSSDAYRLFQIHTETNRLRGPPPPSFS